MPISVTLGQDGTRQYFFRLSDRSYITFFEWNEVEPVKHKHHGAAVKGPFIFDHISIGVSKKTHLFQIQDELEIADQAVSDVIDHGFILSIYTYDPNGIPLEFSWLKDNVNVTKDPILMDKKPAAELTNGLQPLDNTWPVPDKYSDESQWIIVPGQGAV